MAFRPSNRKNDQTILFRALKIANKWHTAFPTRRRIKLLHIKPDKSTFSTVPTPYNRTKGQSYNNLNSKIVNKRHSTFLTRLGSKIFYAHK
ncbi:hypothetical protein KY284_035979 [Solanum tuberosum]|nr:hypothetical protein KY284_035979 [Solanum tuberosum]